MTMQYENPPLGFGPRAMIVRLLRMGFMTDSEAQKALSRLAAIERAEAAELHLATIRQETVDEGAKLAHKLLIEDGHNIAAEKVFVALSARAAGTAP